MYQDYCYVHHPGSVHLPCAWPDCAKGWKDDVYNFHVFADKTKEYKREFFIAPDGDPRYFWISESDSYGWVIRSVINGEFNRLAYKDVPTIYHYTTLDGFQGIVNSSDLWLTESAFLNDASEVNHGVALSQEVFNRLNINEAQIGGFLQQIINIPQKEHPRINIACFSNTQDSLSQWRAYGGDLGISIAFRTRNLLQSFGYPDCRLNHVIYDDDKKRFLLETYFRFHVEAYTRDSKRTIRVMQKDLSYKDHLPITGYDAMLRYLYFELMATFKHSAFSDEREVRLFYAEHEDVINSFELSRAKTRFRTGKGFIVPYTTLDDIRTAVKKDFEKERLAIAEVMVGPHPRSELAALSVRRFLDEHGYQDVPVVTSKTPYR